MHVLAAQALAAVVGSDPAFLDAMLSGRGRSVTCQLDSKPKPGSFVFVNGVVFHRGAFRRSHGEADLMVYDRADGKARVICFYCFHRRPFSVFRMQQEGEGLEYVERIGKYFDLSVALRCAARLESIE